MEDHQELDGTRILSMATYTTFPLLQFALRPGLPPGEKRSLDLSHF